MTAFGMVLDCVDPARLAEFWSAALGYVNVGTAGSYVALIDPDGVGPKLLLQQVPEAKTVKNRMHLDIQSNDIRAEARRLEQLGAPERRRGLRDRAGLQLGADGRSRGQRVLRVRRWRDGQCVIADVDQRRTAMTVQMASTVPNGHAPLRKP